MKYCDRECQKAAWKDHRMMCRAAPPTDMPLIPPDIGYSTPMTAGRALHDWYIIHQWALNAIGDAIIRLHGGIDVLLEPGPRRTLVFTVTAGESMEQGGNPAKAFKLSSVNIVKSEEHYATAGRAEDMQRRCDNLTADLGRGGAFAIDRTLAGMLCAACVVAGTGVINHELLALYRLPLRHVPNDSQDIRSRRALVQTVEFLKAAVASGAVLRYRENNPREEPERGGYVRTRRSWKFQRLQDDRWESLVRSDSRNRQTVPTHTELTPREMLTLFDARGSFLTLRNLGA